MMGPRQEAQGALFYEFSLEDHVPADHLMRSIDRFVDLSGIRSHLAPFYSATGRPSVDPALMIRMLLIGYCMGIRSERRLCEGEARPATGSRGEAEPSEPRLPLVLPPRPDGPGPRSFDLLEEPAWPVPCERFAPASLRERRGALHHRGPGWRRALRGRCQLDPGRCQQAELDATR